MNWRAFATGESLRAFVALEAAGWRLLARRGWEAWAEAVVRGEAQVVGSVGGGRAAHPLVRLPDGGEGVVRRYHRGGLVRHLNRDRYFAGHRAFEELAATERARAAGVAAPEVLVAAEHPARPGYRALLATRRIEGAVGIDRWLSGAGDTGVAVLEAAGEQIRRMHQAGIAHPDLNLRNLLVAPGRDGTPSVHLIDFDRARLSAEPVPPSRRASDLLRLVRSAAKLRLALAPGQWEALARGYGDGWPLSSLVP